MIKSETRPKLTFVTPDHAQWDEYVAMHPHGAIFHTRSMIRVFAATANYSHYAYAAVNDSGTIVAMLVSVHVTTVRGLPALSSRAIQFAEPLCNFDSEGHFALEELIAQHDAYMRSRALFAEVRPIVTPGSEKVPLLSAGYEYSDFINVEIDLRASSEVLWRNVKKSMRQKINSTARKGISLRDDNSMEGVGRLYELLQCSYSRARVPLAHRSLFESAITILPPEMLRIRTAFDGDTPVASIISLLYRGRVFSWYGGTLRLKGRSPFASIIWDDMRWGHEHNYSVYDFGGAGWPHENWGIRRFKASFGGNETHHGRYRITYSKTRLKLAEFAYGISQRIGTW